jgi:adenosylhomocysteine nucleosidase
LTEPVLGVVCALRSEARHLGRSVERHAGLRSLADGTLVAISGMGLAAAAAGTRRLIAAGADCLMSFGMAGGVDPALAAGRLFLPRELSAPDGGRFTCDPAWHAQLARALATAVTEGGLATVRTPLATVAAKASLRQTSGARAVDMESSAVAELAQRHALPFIAVRVIIDDAQEELPAAIAAATGADGQVAPWRVFAHLLRHPGEGRAVLRLARAYAAANATLASVAASGALRRGRDLPGAALT